MRTKPFVVIATLAALICAAPVAKLLADDSARTVAGTFKVDPVHSQGVYRITHLGTSAHWGIFHEPTGTIDVNADGTIKLDITFPVDKIDTGNDKRDQHLKGPDFFNAKQFPTMTFKSTDCTKSGDDLKVKGDLTIKGTTKSIEVTFKKVGQGQNPMSKQDIVGYESEFTINRADYNMNYMPGALGNEVKIIVGFEADKQ